MVDMIVRGMTRWPVPAIFGVALVALVVHFALRSPVVHAATFTSPYWTVTSPSPECACDNCGCEGPSEWTTPGVSVRTGELAQAFPILSTPGIHQPLTISLLWRSMISGTSEFGNGIVPNWKMVKEDVLIPGNPTGPGGHEAQVFIVACKKTPSASPGWAGGRRRHSPSREEALRWERNRRDRGVFAS